MKIRHYHAKDMRQALNQVREAQGPDAIILSSRRTDSGVEVVAAVDFDVEHGVATPSARTSEMHSWMERSEAAQQAQPDAANAADLSSELVTLRRMLETQVAMLAWNDLNRRAPLQTALLKELTQLGFAHSLVLDVVSQIPARLEWQAAQRMALALIAKQIKVDEQRWLDGGGMVAFVGATGVGKSSLLAKLAARWVLQNGAANLVMISTDTVRIGAHDQIQNLGRLLGVPTYCLDRMTDLPGVLNQVAARDNQQPRLILIDTAGLSQRDPRLATEFNLLTRAHAQLEVSLVVSASTQAGTLEETFTGFAALQPRSCVLTKLDEATSLGGSISALVKHGLPLTYTSEGQSIPEDLLPARAHRLIARAVELARRSGANTDEELLTLRFGGVAHALA
jgi:flagellar biosynthesis protein FlhF